jgi:uncharacterized membrane protein YcaP (DUF421 family)
MNSEMLTEQQLLTALRRERLESPEEAARAFIEADGKITVIPKKKRATS